MKRVLLLAAAVWCFVACVDRQGEGTMSKAELQQELSARDSMINEVFTSLNAITANLNTIKERENVITSATQDAEIGKEPIARINEDISAIDELLKSNRETMARLEQSAEALRKANIRIGSLEKLIVEMTAQMEGKNSEIATLKRELGDRQMQVDSLTGQVGDLHTQVSGLTEDYSELEGEFRDQKDAANTAYYIVGSRRELIDKEIVYKSGLIGRTLKVNENRSLDNFTRIDIRYFEEVILDSKDVEIVTTHPAGSYEFVMSQTGEYASLVIKDKEKFWESSKVLIISYK